MFNSGVQYMPESYQRQQSLEIQKFSLVVSVILHKIIMSTSDVAAEVTGTGLRQKTHHLCASTSTRPSGQTPVHRGCPELLEHLNNMCDGFNVQFSGFRRHAI
jgi:hypothetical protein